MLENNTPKKTSNNQGDEVLARVTPRQAERFLVELANLRLDLVSQQRFRARFQTQLPEYPSECTPYHSYLMAGHEGPIEFSDDEMALREVRRLREWLRFIWGARDSRTMRWRVFSLMRMVETQRLEKAYAPMTGGRDIPDPVDPRGKPSLGSIEHVDHDPPTAQPFQQMLVYLQESVERLRICPHPDCPARYFFAKRRNQKYCSDACAILAKREGKRRWWREHGDRWRKQRSMKRRVHHKRKGKKGG